MGFREYKIVYTDKDNNTYTLKNVSDVRVTLKKDAKSNSAEITLNNYNQEFVVGGEVQFKEGEKLDIYATEGFVEIGNDAHLLGTFIILDTELSPLERKIKLICSDNTYKMLASLYTADINDNVNDIVFNVVQSTDQTGDTQNSVATNITTVDSQGNPLPVKNYVSVWKTAYESINELSQTDYTGDDRAYIFWFDSDGTFNWVYPSQTPEQTEFTFGTESIIDMKFTKTESATINMLIYDAGEDKNGASILDFEYRKDAGSIKGSVKYQPMTEISKQIRWSLGEATYNTIDNDTFVALCKVQAISKAQAIIDKVGQGLWKSTVTMFGTKITPGELYKHNASRIGFQNIDLRVDSVIHTMNVNGWQTKVTLLEDVSPIEI